MNAMRGTRDTQRDGRHSRAMKHLPLVASTGVNALYVLALQVLALTTLDPESYGMYSIQYLTYALAASVCLSVLSEAWLRTDISTSYRSPWRDYSGVLMYVALAAGVVTLFGSLLISSLRGIAWLGAIAVAASTYRSGARYFALRVGLQRYVLMPDLLGLIATLLVWSFFLHQHVDSLTSMVAVWATGAVIAGLLSRLPTLRPPSVVRMWISVHRTQIGPLLRDSLLLDLGAIGTPYFLAPVLGLSSFGTYRAVSNTSAPVRFVLTPLRPVLSATPLTAHRSPVRGLVNLATGLIFGLGAFIFLSLFGSSGVQLGTLTQLAPFALPTAIYVSANFIGQYYYIVARGHSSGRSLLRGRIIQTLLVTILPIGGALLGGLAEVIWSYTAATVAWSAVWVLHVLRAARGSTTDPGRTRRARRLVSRPRSKLTI